MNLFELLALLSTTEYDKKICDFFDALQNFAGILENVKKHFLDFAAHYSVDGLYEVLCSYMLLDIYYPPCLYLSREQSKQIVLLLSNGQNTSNIERVEQIIFEKYNDELIVCLTQKWKSLVQEERFPILQEGVHAYLNGYYYACNTTLLSQVGGIIVDNDLKFSECNLNTVIQKLETLENEQKSNNKNITSEKNTLQRHLLINLQGSLCAFAIYCSDYLYSSGNISQKILDNVANRNKVLHGETCNFGTKVMALKTIITIDLLIHLPKYQLMITEGKSNDN